MPTPKDSNERKSARISSQYSLHELRNNWRMDHLQALDYMFLGLEDETVQANIGAVSVFDGPAPSIKELRRRAESKIGLIPRYRQKILATPGGVGYPMWVDHEDFEIADHLYETDLGRKVTAERVQDHFGSVIGTHLDREKPLWKIEMIRGLPGGQWAVIWVVHHAMVDGIAASEMMLLLLDANPDAGIDDKPGEWTPQDPPALIRAAASTVAGPAGPRRLARDIASALRRPRHAVREAARTAGGLLPAGRLLITPNDSPLNGPIGPERIWRVAELDLAKVKSASKRHGGTVNDVVLAAVTAGLRAHVIDSGVDPSTFETRTMVPVSVRTEDERGEALNRVSAVFVELPVALDDPVERLEVVRKQMDELKERQAETTAQRLGEVADYIPNSLFGAGERTVIRFADTARFFNTITTNVPGPQFPLYCLGRRMRTIHPYVLLAKDLRITTAIFSYDGRIFFGVTGDRASVPDLGVMCAGIEDSLDELLVDHAAA